MNVILIGMPGSGKSRIGRELSFATHLEYVDTDALIRNKYGDIDKIFQDCGEEYFRDRETEAVKKASEKDGIIISTGGGTVLREENVKVLKANGVFIYLKASEDTLIRRTASSNRPLLKGGTDKLKKLYKERCPIYEKYADLVLDADGDDIARKIKEIRAFLTAL